jgi:hypothetical protein
MCLANWCLHFYDNTQIVWDRVLLWLGVLLVKFIVTLKKLLPSFAKCGDVMLERVGLMLITVFILLDRHAFY